jgi:hypothetical protein
MTRAQVIAKLGFDPEGQVDTPRPGSIDSRKFGSVPPLDESQATALASADGGLRITLFDRLASRSDLNEAADLQAGDDDLMVFVMVFAERKAELEQSITLKDYAKFAVDKIASAMPAPRRGIEQPLTIGGLPALERELHGIVGGYELGYLITAVESPDAFYQIVIYTTRYRWGQYEGTIKRMSRSFTVVN